MDAPVVVHVLNYFPFGSMLNWADFVFFRFPFPFLLLEVIS